MVTLIWTMGITGYLQLTITVVTMVAAAMIMGLGISYGIHVVHRFYELKQDKTKGLKKVIEELQEELITALFGSSMTTSAGFLALLFGVLPAMKNLGIILGMGILITFIVAITILPTLLFITENTKKNKNYVYGGKKQ
jgi:hypothetical protein